MFEKLNSAVRTILLSIGMAWSYFTNSVESFYALVANSGFSPQNIFRFMRVCINLTATSIVAVFLSIAEAVRLFFQLIYNVCGHIKRRVCKMLYFQETLENCMVLSAGSREIKIPCGRHVETVWVSLEDCHGIPVCHGNIDKIGVEIGHHSFTLYADIFSNSRKVCWRAVLR